MGVIKMPMDKYKSFYEIVKMLCKLDLTKLRAIEKEIKILGKIKSKLKRKGRKRKARFKKGSPAAKAYMKKIRNMR